MSLVLAAQPVTQYSELMSSARQTLTDTTQVDDHETFDRK